MKRLTGIILTLSLVASAVATGATVIKASALNGEVTVLGDLGLPLGQVVEIEATIASGESLRDKGNGGSYLLKVTKIGAEVQEDGPLFNFDSRPGSHPGERELASHTFALYEIKTGRTTGQLSSEQIANLERDYVGQSYRLLVYELGEFSGIPKGMPRDYAVWQDYSFHFSTRLVVLRVLH